MFKINNRYNRTRCEVGSKLTIKTPERRHWCHSGVFIVNFKHIPQIVLVNSRSDEYWKCKIKALPGPRHCLHCHAGEVKTPKSVVLPSVIKQFTRNTESINTMIG